MKYFILVVFLLVCSPLFSQDLKYSDLQGRKKRGGFKFDSYLSKGGQTYQPGDTLKIGAPAGVNGQFNYITQAGIGGVRNAENDVSGFLVVKKIVLAGLRKTGFVPTLVCHGNLAGSYTVVIEKAIESKEVVQ